MRSCTQHPDPPAGVLDDRQHVQARAGYGDVLEEVAGKQGAGLGAEEAGPGGGGTLGRRVDPRLLQDLPDGGGSDLDAEDEQLAVDAAVTQRGFSRARRSTSRRMERTVRGRPGRLGRDLAAWQRASRSRCQRCTVSGRTSNRNRPSTSRGSRCSRAARNARSARENRGRALPSCRSRTMIWWRSAKISTSLAWSLIGRSRNNAHTFVTPR